MRNQEIFDGATNHVCCCTMAWRRPPPPRRRSSGKTMRASKSKATNGVKLQVFLGVMWQNVHRKFTRDVSVEHIIYVACGHSVQRVELAPQNENQCKIVTFHMFMVQCKSVTIWFVSDLRAHPWPPKNFASFVTILHCGKASFLGGHGCARGRKKCRTCNFRMSGIVPL
jgi:hypothetical protein